MEIRIYFRRMPSFWILDRAKAADIFHHLVSIEFHSFTIGSMFKRIVNILESHRSHKQGTYSIKLSNEGNRHTKR